MHNKINQLERILVTDSLKNEALVTEEEYFKLYSQSIDDPEGFWGEMGQCLNWIKPWSKVKKTSYHKPIEINWFQGGQLNASINCIDRHLIDKNDKVALIWEPDNPNVPSRKITYSELSSEVNKFANVLKKLGVQKGDRVSLYMPMIPETAFAMLACSRIGAIHSLIFAGFSPESIRDRLIDSHSRVIITSDLGYRGGKELPLKNNVDKAIQGLSFVETVLVVNYDHTPHDCKDKEVCFWKLHGTVSCVCEPVAMDSSDPLFILYTSGSTGKPKGVLHGTGGYLVYASVTHKYIFNYKGDEIYWCSADLGWVTGHTYILYGPLLNGGTTLLFEGVPHYPDSSRFWQVVDKHHVEIFYTAPTAIRALMREGDEYVEKTKRTSLKILGSVGEPINPEAWLWYYQKVGNSNCPVLDTWWQTETGGILIAPLPGATSLKPGSATRPFFGIKPALLTPEGKVIPGVGEGVLVLEDSWPGQMLTVYGNQERFEETYFSAFPGYYFTGDGCRRDDEGYYWITGRVDDVINVSGHRLGTAEIESALVAHDKVAEAAVVGIQHDIKGQGIYAYVTLKKGETYSESLKQELIQWVRSKIGPLATPEFIHWAKGLPKTRSGKIMRRILRKIAEGEWEQLGDITTLSDPQVIPALKLEKRNKLSF